MCKNFDNINLQFIHIFIVFMFTFEKLVFTLKEKGFLFVTVILTNKQNQMKVNKKKRILLKIKF